MSATPRCLRRSSVAPEGAGHAASPGVRTAEDLGNAACRPTDAGAELLPRVRARDLPCSRVRPPWVCSWFPPVRTAAEQGERSFDRPARSAPSPAPCHCVAVSRLGPPRVSCVPAGMRAAPGALTPGGVCPRGSGQRLSLAPVRWGRARRPGHL